MRKEHDDNPHCGCPVIQRNFATRKVIVDHRPFCQHFDTGPSVEEPMPKPDVAPEELLPNGCNISPSQAVQLMSLAVLVKDGELLLKSENNDMATAAFKLIQDVGQEIALQVKKDEPEPEQPANVFQLHKSYPAQQVIPTLQTILKEIEDGKFGTVTTACVCIGHTYEEEMPGEPIRKMMSNFYTFAAGPRVDMFTVRGLLLTCANTLGNG